MKLDAMRKRWIIQGIDGVLSSAKEINEHIDKLKVEIASLLSDAEATRRTVEKIDVFDKEVSP